MLASTVSAPSALQMLLGLYGFLLPTLLYVLWSTLALWDIGRRTDLSAPAVWAWTLLIFLLPFLGPLAYLLFGAAKLPARSRLLAVLGGGGAYVLVLIAATALGVS